MQAPPPVFAAIAALLVVQPSLNQSFSTAIERSVGVIVGVVIASLLGIAFGEDTWVILVSIVVALIVAWAARATSGTANQAAISALLVLSLGAATPGYAIDRVLETIIGAAIGIIVNVSLVPPVAGSLARLAAALERPRSRADLEELLLTARLMRPMRDAAEDDAIADEPTSRAIADQLRRAAHDVRLDVRTAESAAQDPSIAQTASVPALTAPLVIPTPSPDHWIPIGSLLEDLRRIHATLSRTG